MFVNHNSQTNISFSFRYEYENKLLRATAQWWETVCKKAFATPAAHLLRWAEGDSVPARSVLLFRLDIHRYFNVCDTLVQRLGRHEVQTGLAEDAQAEDAQVGRGLTPAPTGEQVGALAGHTMVWSWTCCTRGPSTHQCVAHYPHLPAGRVVHCAGRSLCFFPKDSSSHSLEHVLKRTGFQQPLGQLAQQHERAFHVCSRACGQVLVERRACPALWPTPVLCQPSSAHYALCRAAPLALAEASACPHTGQREPRCEPAIGVG